MKENGLDSPAPSILLFIPLKMMVEMRKPDMTKKTSTPTNPDLKMLSGKAWKRTTEMTAMARRPSISGRYLRLRWEPELTNELLRPVRGGGILPNHLIYTDLTNHTNYKQHVWQQNQPIATLLTVSLQAYRRLFYYIEKYLSARCATGAMPMQCTNRKIAKFTFGV